MLAYSCGLRLSEIQNLATADIDWDRGVIRKICWFSKKRGA